MESVKNELDELSPNYTQEAYRQASDALTDCLSKLDQLDTILFAEAASTDEPDVPPEVTF